MNSSTAATSPSPHASLKNLRTRALFFSSADIGVPVPLQIANSRFLQSIYALHHAIRWAPTHRLKAYSLNVLEGAFPKVSSQCRRTRRAKRVLARIAYPTARNAQVTVKISRL